MTPMKLESADLRSQVKHSTTEPLRSLNSLFKMGSNDCYGIMIELNISYISTNLMTAIITLRCIDIPINILINVNNLLNGNFDAP